MNSKLYLDNMKAKKKNDEYLHSMMGDLIEYSFILAKKGKYFEKDAFNLDKDESDMDKLFSNGKLSILKEDTDILPKGTIVIDSSINDGIVEFGSIFFAIKPDNTVEIRKDSIEGFDTVGMSYTYSVTDADIIPSKEDIRLNTNCFGMKNDIRDVNISRKYKNIGRSYTNHLGNKDLKDKYLNTIKMIRTNIYRANGIQTCLARTIR